MNEEWRDIEGYEECYQISNLGRVKSLKFNKDRILKPRKDKYGYLQVGLCKDGKVKRYLVHRLVANAFIPNSNNLEDINHINEIKTDNRLSNLEWMTHRDNIRYSKTKSVNQYTKDGRFVKTWDCIIEVQNQLGFGQGNICSCCQGKLKSSYGFKWFYSNDLRQPEPPLW